MFRPFVGLFVCLFAATSLFAQTDRAVLRGVVKDSSGAAVPTSHITVTEIQVDQFVDEKNIEVHIEYQENTDNSELAQTRIVSLPLLRG